MRRQQSKSEGKVCDAKNIACTSTSVWAEIFDPQILNYCSLRFGDPLEKILHVDVPAGLSEPPRHVVLFLKSPNPSHDCPDLLELCKQLGRCLYRGCLVLDIVRCQVQKLVNHVVQLAPESKMMSISIFISDLKFESKTNCSVLCVSMYCILLTVCWAAWV